MFKVIIHRQSKMKFCTSLLFALFLSSVFADSTYPLPYSYYIGIGYEPLNGEFQMNVMNLTFNTNNLSPYRHGKLPDNVNGYSL